MIPVDYWRVVIYLIEVVRPCGRLSDQRVYAEKLDSNYLSYNLHVTAKLLQAHCLAPAALHVVAS